MDYEDLMRLIDRIDESNLSYLDYQTESRHVILSKEMPQIKNQSDANASIFKTEIIDQEKVNSLTESEESVQDESQEIFEEVGEIVRSPMIGVAYLQANPNEDVYVNVGDQIEEEETVCIIEAMKLMNEIQAPKSGVVTEILIENEEVVEFNQPLIRIK